MSAHSAMAQPEPQDPTLRPSEVADRVGALAKLQSALAALGIRCVLARHHRLVLRSPAVSRCSSGQTDPRPHVLAADGPCTVITDGTAYRLDTGQVLQAADPATAAALIVAGRHRAAASTGTTS